MVDILRWGMEEDYPVSVNSVGGRFRYQDDWETPRHAGDQYEFRRRQVDDLGGP